MRTTARKRFLVLAIVLAAGALLAARYFGQSEPVTLPYEKHRAPARNPPVDPNRPDLYEEPSPPR